MGKTMSEKILAMGAGVSESQAGDILWVNIDKAMLDDILGPRVEIADRMKEIKDEIWDPSKVVVISDHYTPPYPLTRRRLSSSRVTGPNSMESTTTMNLSAPATRSW